MVRFRIFVQTIWQLIRRYSARSRSHNAPKLLWVRVWALDGFRYIIFRLSDCWKIIQYASLFVFFVLWPNHNLFLWGGFQFQWKTRLFRPLILTFHKGACLLINFKNSTWTKLQANSTSSKGETRLHSKLDKSRRKACSWKYLKVLLSRSCGLVFRCLAFLQ